MYGPENVFSGKTTRTCLNFIPCKQSPEHPTLFSEYLTWGSFQDFSDRNKKLSAVYKA
jgi:hypothetical protein